jgi:type II secretion system protein D
VPAVVLSGSEADVRGAERLLSQTDVATPAPPPVFEAITPRNISANALAGIVEKAAPDVTVTVQGDTVIVSGPREAVERVRTMAPTVDVPGGAGRRVEIYNIKYSSAQALAVMLASAVPGLLVTPSAEPYAPPAPRFSPLTNTGSTGSGTGGRSGGAGGGLGGLSGLGGGGGGATTPDASGGATAFSTVKSRSLILSGRDTDVEEALRLLDALDIAPVQVEIETHIVDLNVEDTLDFGIQWGGTTQSTGGTGTAPTFTQGATGTIGVPEQNVPGIIRFGRFTRGPINFAAQLRFLETRNRGKTLARPHISVIDNEDASIFIGQIIRFQLESTGALGAQTVEVEEIPVGITLLVRPRVNANDEITMKVKPVVSTVIPSNSGLPQTASREADSTLRVRDGETIVIGGLIQDQELKIVEQVPLLGRIPLFGELFRRRNNRRTRSEVLVFLTPHLLRENGAAAAAETLSRYPDVKKLNPPALPGEETPKK